MKTFFKNIDEYIQLFPEDVRSKLEELRAVIKEVVPEATEAIAYQMPTFRLNGNLVHFAAFKDHIGFYPAPSGVSQFKKDLAKYKTSKGTIQIPIDAPIPFDLIKEIVRFRVKENLSKAK